VKKTRGMRGARLYAWAATSSARDGAGSHVNVRFSLHFHQYACLFLLYTVVWLKHDFDNFHFLAKIKHHFKPYTLIPIVGVPTSNVLIVAH
jgi:hypothetical protein